MRPHLTQKTRDMMYSLHAANPEKWDDTALAKKFGLVAYVIIATHPRLHAACEPAQH